MPAHTVRNTTPDWAAEFIPRPINLKGGKGIRRVSHTSNDTLSNLGTFISCVSHTAKDVRS